MIKIVQGVNNILGTDDYVLVLDQGYWKIKHIEEIYDKNTMVIIPDKGAATRQKIINALKNKLKLEEDKITEETFKKYNFIFLPEEDVYICPFGMLLTRQDKYNKTNRKTKLYACNNCYECPYKELCAKDKDGREFREPINHAVEEVKFFFTILNLGGNIIHIEGITVKYHLQYYLNLENSEVLKIVDYKELIVK